MLSSSEYPAGSPYPLGATIERDGVNFALFSANAEAVELCLFDSADDSRESRRIPLLHKTDQIWHVFVPGIHAGQLYGYRVSGPYSPAEGFRFNSHKVLFDPYAREVGRDVIWDNSLFAYEMSGSEDDDLYMDDSDNAAFCPLGRVAAPIAPAPNNPPLVPWPQTIVYEAHVKGATAALEGIPNALRGTYAGMAQPAFIEHLKKLGVTTLELLPVHHRVTEWSLQQNGLTNYWGYNSLAFMCPDSRFTSGEYGSTAEEFRYMVDSLHAAGIEVLIDVVYNHTAEGSHLGPSLSFRGIDNASYYRLSEQNLRYNVDFTGCGNTFNVRHPRVLQLIMDSLRYFASELHVDGFRFDLAPALGRDESHMDPNSAFFDIINQDPVLSRRKLIAEPWDLGEQGYQVGNFPVLWREWNGRYRDTVRSFWRGDKRMIGAMASRLAGSSDLYFPGGRGPDASINFITCHDGFTLNDLVAFNTKRNLENREDNRDGNNDNRSWNCGHEGLDAPADVLELRERQKRNFLATLFLSAGVPMLLGGDEFGRTQSGNNNAYCQDNPTAWFDWAKAAESETLTAFVSDLIRLRKSAPTWQRATFFRGTGSRGAPKDIAWLRADGQELRPVDWSNPDLHHLGVYFGSEPIAHTARALRQQATLGPAFLLLLNAENAAVRFALPKYHKQWELLIDTALEPAVLASPKLQPVSKYAMVSHSLVLLRAH